MKTTLSCIALLFAASVVPAYAQDNDSPDISDGEDTSPTIFDGDFVTLGIGAGIAPSYEGSDSYVLIPAPVMRGKVSGFEFATRGPGLFVDLIRDPKDAKVEFIAGPIARVRLDRNSRIRDDVVKSLGDRDIAIELGGSLGVEFNGLLNPYDTVTLSSDILFDVAGAHGGKIITPSISYGTPLSPGSYVSLTGSADYVDDDYADYYYTVTPAGSVASGLPVFQADSGWKSIGATLLGAYDFSGDIRDGGWGAFAIGNYSRLQNDAAATPITAIRGDADQWFGAAGLTYTF